MNRNTIPFSNELLNAAMEENGIRELSEASIREVVAVIRYLENHSSQKILRMDMGIPGLHTPQIGVDSEVEALKNGKSAIYGQIDGIPELKKEIARFVKLFLDVEVAEKSCIVTAGSMMGSMITFMVAAKREMSRQGVLFIDPGFPVQKKQAHVMNLPIFSFDIYNYRGKKLYDKLEDICAKNGISVIVYSNPNNPTWTCLTEDELKTIGDIANRHDIIVAEDLAYFGMDFRHDYSKPGEPPYQPTIAKYTDNYLLLISSSKVFSFAGQRVGMLVVSDKLYHREFENLLTIGDNPKLGPSMVMDGVYVISAGTSHSGQYGLAGMLKAVNDGKYNFLEPLKEYAFRAHEMKKIFIKNGFQILYDRDGDVELADGFYFTITYPGMDEEELISRLMRCGLGTISLKITGSKSKPGVRISVSMIDQELFTALSDRLTVFAGL
jgi:aspartate/methionine/tyrosine aminotransferase